MPWCRRIDWADAEREVRCRAETAPGVSIEAAMRAGRLDRSLTERKECEMEQHVRVVAVIDLVWGGIILLSMLMGVSAFVFLAFGLVEYGDDGGPALMALTPLLVLILFWAVVLGCAWIIAGIGLLKLRPWARILQIVLAIFGLLCFPLGTAFGIYALWVLLSAEGAAVFPPQRGMQL
jgi:hypothetical protein